MKKSKARREWRRREYQRQLRQWEMKKPAWWRFFARRKWLESKPRFDRR